MSRAGSIERDADLSTLTRCESPGQKGSGGGARTHDPLINSQMLCQLSYPGKRVAP